MALIAKTKRQSLLLLANLLTACCTAAAPLLQHGLSSSLGLLDGALEGTLSRAQATQLSREFLKAYNMVGGRRAAVLPAV